MQAIFTKKLRLLLAKKEKMDKELVASYKAKLYKSSLSELCIDQRVIDFGALIICRQGKATMHIDFRSCVLVKDSIIMLFPNDVVALSNISADFEVEILRYDPSLLREASLQLEQTVYNLLRKDRCRSNKHVISEIVNGMFNLLGIYFRQPECLCTDQLVLYQMKAFIIGFYDYIIRNQPIYNDKDVSQRINELFNQFMEALERNYMVSHDVNYYAKYLCITPKYLNTITKIATKHTPKVIIDHYVILQLKKSILQSNSSVKQLAYSFHFSDASFLCRYFKQHTGMTLQEYRKKQAIKINKD